tara:strand:+ start:285 stop:842 length:558 start_codon:yes stop_codon:yes gene_type:complete
MGELKQLLPWKGTTMIRHQIGVLDESGCDEIIVVLGYKTKRIEDDIRCTGVKIVHNPDFRLSKALSIRIGMSAVSESQHSIVLLGVDQPRTKSIVSRLIVSHKDNSALITSPVFNGRRGHPAIFSSSILGDLMSVDDDSLGVKGVFERYKKFINFVDLQDPQVRLDLNNKRDYDEAYGIYGVGES